MPPKTRMWLVLAHFREPHGALPGGVEVRPVTDADAPHLPRLLLDAYHDTIEDGGDTLEDAEAEIARIFAGEYGKLAAEASFVAVAPDGGRPLGACLIVHAARPLLLYLVVDPSAQGRGLGMGLLTRSIAALRKTGAADLWLGVHPENQKAIGLFEKVEFVYA